MKGAYAKMLFYAAAVTAASVEFFASVLAGIWHPLIYWTSVASIIPIGLFGIWYIAFLHAPARKYAVRYQPERKYASHHYWHV